jgi:hypothetical protein
MINEAMWDAAIDEAATAAAGAKPRRANGNTRAHAMADAAKRQRRQRA